MSPRPIRGRAGRALTARPLAADAPGRHVGRPGLAWPPRGRFTWVRAAAATAVAAMTAVPAAPAMASAGRPGLPREPAGSSHGAALARAAAPAHVSVSITSVKPRIARPGKPVTVSGIVSNPTAGSPAGLWVQLWSSGTFLPNRESMALYVSATGSTGFDQPVSGAEHVFASPLPPHSTERWSLTFRTGQMGMHSFGVYPLAAELNGPLGGMDAARTFLPFWPGKPASQAVKPLKAAWVWPLIDSPQQAACKSLRSDELATSVTGNGRLGGLLAAGRTQAARQARLTWAIDPAVISDVSLMTRPYRIGVSDTCTGGKARPTRSAARAWLAGVRAVASQQDFFITPYADVDVAALIHRGLNGELHAAFGVGRSVALKLLRLTQRPPPTRGAIAWPPNGIADYSVIEGLAAKNKVRTLILDDSVMPPAVPVSFTPGAVTSTTDGLGNRLHVLLADHTLAHILGTARTQIPGAVPAPSPATGSTGLTQAATFAKEQWFLAETAMIAAEYPSLARSVVIAPPRRWTPPPGMAEALLTETAHAPWLRPASLASLIAARPTAGDVKRQQPPQRKMSDGELRAPLLRQVHKLTGQVRLLGSVLSTGGHGYLATALAAIESSAWRGGRADQRHAQQMLHQVSNYVLAQWKQIQIIGSVHITLGGRSGAVPVSISNGLNVAVNVGLKVSVPGKGQVQVGKPPRVITVDAHTQRTIKLSVRTAAAGSTTLTLQLTTPAGKPLPGQSATLTVEATHFGTLALVIIVVALVVFVLTAAGRAFRRGGPAPGDEGEGAERSETHQTQPHTASEGAEADSVVGQGAGAHAAEEADDHASAPGQAQRR